jgi:glycosyltransferase involved in cell wall biosynthesis
VVASAVPGLAEAVPAAAGALVPPDDAAALADALARRLLDRALTRAEGVAAARHAARFDTRTTYDRLAMAITATVRRREAKP